MTKLAGSNLNVLHTENKSECFLCILHCKPFSELYLKMFVKPKEKKKKNKNEQAFGSLAA